MEDMKRSDGLITSLGPKSPITEAFRTLRTNLEFMSPDQPLRTLLFTSSGPGEGKSTTTANAAISMAQAGKKVLLIDCDLRKPVQHKVFGLSNLQGITSLLVDHSLSLEELPQYAEISNLHVLPCGPIPPNPAELLGSQRMSSLLQEALGKYDLILLDTPPIISVTDSAVLSSMVDGVILVVGAGQADKNMVKKAYGLLENVKARVLGVVMNKVQIEKGFEYYYYYAKDETYAG